MKTCFRLPSPSGAEQAETLDLPIPLDDHSEWPKLFVV